MAQDRTHGVHIQRHRWE